MFVYDFKTEQKYLLPATVVARRDLFAPGKEWAIVEGGFLTFIFSWQILWNQKRTYQKSLFAFHNCLLPLDIIGLLNINNTSISKI